MTTTGLNTSTPPFTFASASHVGRVRSVNEDSYIERPDIGLWAVADGMGGHSRGDVASRLVCEALARLSWAGSGLDLLNGVRGTLHDANRELRRQADTLGDGQTVGTTVVVLLIHQNHYACVWAGDSRCYLLRDGLLTRITHDHSVVQSMIDQGVLEEAGAEHHPLANVVTQALGAPGDLDLATVHGPLAPGDLLLLCTDGLTRMVPEDTIAALLQRDGPDSVRPLIDAALAAGGRDNVTAVVVSPDDGTRWPDGLPGEDDGLTGLDVDRDDTALHRRGSHHG